jgi:hypothetical protein
MPLEELTLNLFIRTDCQYEPIAGVNTLAHEILVHHFREFHFFCVEAGSDRGSRGRRRKK